MINGSVKMEVSIFEERVSKGKSLLYDLFAMLSSKGWKLILKLDFTKFNIFKLF